MSGRSTHTWTHRTHTCGELRLDNCGESVVLNGWVHRRRDQGGLIFIDLRDRYGITQVVISRDENAAAHETATDTRAEYVLGVIGNVRQRPASTVNDELRTGEIEIGDVGACGERKTRHRRDPCRHKKTPDADHSRSVMPPQNAPALHAIPIPKLSRCLWRCLCGWPRVPRTCRSWQHYSRFLLQ